MKYRKAKAFLDSHIDVGMKLGLDRMRVLLNGVFPNHGQIRTIHVAGTNGKTSTTWLAASLLKWHGVRVGAYTSPHLEMVEERFAVDGTHATQREFSQAIADVAAVCERLARNSGERVSYFELTTAAAFAFFARKGVESAVVEVGLGGRLDATNVIRAEVSVLTGVDLEHTEYLGNTAEAIAIEKLAIAHPGSILVTGPISQPVYDLTSSLSRELGIEHRAFGRDFTVQARPAPTGWLVDVAGVHQKYPTVHLPVHGRHQTVNAAVAIASVEGLLGGPLIPSAVEVAAARFRAPGRMEAVAASPLILLDGAHNPAGFRVLARSLQEEFPTTDWVLLLGAMRDKDLEGMADQIAGRLRRVIATGVTDNDRAIPAAEVAARIKARVGVPIDSIDDPTTALHEARRRAGSDGAVLVTGSLYLVGLIRGIVRAGQTAVHVK